MMPQETPTLAGELVYIADPMCSWCWGFAPVLAEIEERLGRSARLVLGGLAADSDEPMPEETKGFVRSAWEAVAARTGATFNHDFWTNCEPRRSTYPACRAVLAAEAQRAGAGRAMYAAIQRAYYLEARNPSDLSTLEDVASALMPAIDGIRFASDLRSEAINARLHEDLAEIRGWGVTGFPTLVHFGDAPRLITRGWSSFDACWDALNATS